MAELNLNTSFIQSTQNINSMADYFITLNQLKQYKLQLWFYKEALNGCVKYSDLVFAKNRLAFDLLIKAFKLKGTREGIIAICQALYSPEADIIIDEFQGYIDITINNANELFQKKRITAPTDINFNVVFNGQNVVFTGEQLVVNQTQDSKYRITTDGYYRLASVFNAILGQDTKSFIESFLLAGIKLNNFIIN